MKANVSEPVIEPIGQICRVRRCALAVGFMVVGCLSAEAADSVAPPAKASDLYQTSKIWNVRLSFTPEQWQAMEPAESESAMGMRFGGRGGPGGPGGARGPGGFGPAMFLAPAFLKGDQNQDGKLSREEFDALGQGWFKEWDKSKRGQLDLDQLRAGMNSTLAPTGFGGPGGAGGNSGPPGPPLQGAEGHRNGLASAAGIDFKYAHADLDFEGQSLKDVAVRYKGNGTFMESRNSIKRSLKIELNKYSKGQKLAGETKLNLHNNVTDASWMNEVLSYQLFRDAGVPAPRTAYAKVYITVPGKYDKKYFGLYSLVEDVDTHFAHDRFGAKQGSIFKPVTPTLFADLGADWSKYAQTYDPKTALSDADKRRVIEFSKLITSGSDSEFSTKVAEFVNIEEFARFMSVTTWLSTMDSILMMGQNFYVYLHPQTHQFQFVPWDLDHSFGQFPMAGTQEQRENLSIQTPWRGANRFLERMFKNENFKKLYLATMTEFSRSLFVPERFIKQVDEIAAAIRPAVKEESEEKLSRFDKAVAGEPVERFGFGGNPGGPRRGGNPPGGGPRFGGGGFMQAAKPIKDFVVARAHSVSDQLAGKSEGETLTEGGFGGPGRGPGGGGPGGFGPGNFLASGFMDAFDENKDGKISHDEFTAGFAKWFSGWNSDKSGALTETQLREGINRDLAPFRGGPPGGPGFGPPDVGPGEAP
jgi:spore coat protein H